LVAPRSATSEGGESARCSYAGEHNAEASRPGQRRNAPVGLVGLPHGVEQWIDQVDVVLVLPCVEPDGHQRAGPGVALLLQPRFEQPESRGPARSPIAKQAVDERRLGAFQRAPKRFDKRREAQSILGSVLDRLVGQDMNSHQSPKQR
jgi:hypothetical protein